MSPKVRIGRRAAAPHRDDTKTGPAPKPLRVIRRALTLGLLAVLALVMLASLLGLRGVIHQARRVGLSWLGIGEALELASDVRFVVVVRRIFDRLSAGVGRVRGWKDHPTEALRPGRRGRRELGLFLAVYGLYDAGRWMFAGRLQVARAHADWVIHLERSLHVALESGVQRALGWGVARLLLSNIYLAAQLVVLPAALTWMYRRSPDTYRRLRSTVVFSWLLALPVFALYPVAPPRLAGIGLKDTVSHQSAVALTGHSTMFYNPYAAVPSLHVGLAFAIGIAAATTVRSRWAKALALGWGPLVTVAVVVTGNHYLFDVAAGLLTTGLAHTAVRLACRVRISVRRPQRPRHPVPASVAP